MPLGRQNNLAVSQGAGNGLPYTGQPQLLKYPDCRSGNGRVHVATMHLHAD